MQIRMDDDQHEAGQDREAWDFDMAAALTVKHDYVHDAGDAHTD